MEVGHRVVDLRGVDGVVRRRIWLLIGLPVVVALSGYSWCQAEKEALVAEGRATQADAEAFARDAEQRGCVAEALSRTDVCDSIRCEIQTAIFVTTCLDAARPSGGFCDGIPPRTELVASAQWALERCAELDRDGDRSCTRVFEKVQRSCTAEGS